MQKKIKNIGFSLMKEYFNVLADYKSRNSIFFKVLRKIVGIIQKLMEKLYLNYMYALKNIYYSKYNVS